MSNFYQKLCDAIGAASVREQEPMSAHTTFRAGGPARYFVTPEGEKELAAVLAACREAEEAYYILGNGSNLLVSDAGYPGVMVLLGSQFTEVVRPEGEPGVYELGAGVLLSRAAREAQKDGMTGFEFAAGIPGTVGGGIYMNAGAYGGEMKQVVAGVTVMYPNGTTEEIPAASLDLGYRHSRFMEEDCVILRVQVQLQKGNREDIRARMTELMGKRRASQPLEYPSAGSTFKRPKEGYAAALIEQAGLKGRRVGGAQVSEKHAGFVINREKATCEDVLALMAQVEEEVYRSSGIRLEPEVRVMEVKRPCGF